MAGKGSTEMTQRKLREGQYLTNKQGVIFPMSPDLLGCARNELSAGLEERKRQTVRSKTNHTSHHALGSIVLVVTAFDVWLNEVALQVSLIEHSERGRIAAKKPTAAKYAYLMEILGAAVRDSQDLEMAINLRDEIVHYLPRVVDDTGNVPSWLSPLHDRGLLLGGTDEPGFTFPKNLNSYRLAYWVWELIERAVARLSLALQALGPKYEQVGWMAGNFGIYRGVCPPDQLSAYDAEHGLQVPLPHQPGLTSLPGGDE